MRRTEQRATEGTPKSFEELKDSLRLVIDEAIACGAERLQTALRRAALGENAQIEYLCDYIREILVSHLHIDGKAIKRIIRFDMPSTMSTCELFEYMYMILRRNYGAHVFPHLADELGLVRTCFDDYGRAYYVSEERDVREAWTKLRICGDYVDMLDTLVQRLYESLYGHDVADLLIMDPDLDGVSAGVGGRTRDEYNYFEELGRDRGSAVRPLNYYDVIYAVYRGKSVRMAFLGFGSEERLIRVVSNIYRYNTKASLSKKTPVIVATFGNGSRVVVTRPPVSDGWAFYVRKFASSNALGIEELITDEGCEYVSSCLRKIVMGESNFVISGNTGGGKTTLLKALVDYINPAYNLRVAETSFELNLNNIYPDRNIQCLQERGDFSVYDAITTSKKMDTDVLILGEVNEPKVAGAFIQIAQSGSRMAITTLHHETTEKLIEYMRNALISECGISDPMVAERQVTGAIDYDIHMVHDAEGHHYIERITRITQEKDGYSLKDVIMFDKEERRYRRTYDYI